MDESAANYSLIFSPCAAQMLCSARVTAQYGALRQRWETKSICYSERLLKRASILYIPPPDTTKASALTK